MTMRRRTPSPDGPPAPGEADAGVALLSGSPDGTGTSPSPGARWSSQPAQDPAAPTGADIPDSDDPLAEPAQHEDLAAVLGARPARRRMPTLTSGLLVLLVAGGGFVGGVYAQKHAAPAATTPFAGLGTGRTGTGSGAGAAAGAGGAFAGAAGGATAGTIKLVDGTTIYVQTAAGDIVKVTTTPATTVRISQTGTVSQLAPGSTVVVQGSAGADGVVAARSVTQGGGFGARAGG